MLAQLMSVEGCAACVRVRASLEAVARQFEWVTVEEVDLAREPELAYRYGVMACPAVVIDGELCFVGGVDEGRLRELLAAGRTGAQP